eukprot:Opistho-1_new@62722
MFRSLTLAVLILFTLHACKKVAKEDVLLTTPQVSLDIDSIKQRGYLIALVDNNSISYFLYKGQPKGYDCELLQHLAKHLKVRVKLKLISGIENGIRKLNAGEGDIMAYPLTVTEDRKKYVLFAKPQFASHQVLIQRKQEKDTATMGNALSTTFIKNPQDLVNKTVHVLKHSSFVARLESLEMELNADILIEEPMY